MKNVNWDTVQDEIRRPIPGGYAAKITKVTDVEDKEYLLIEWEFAEGELKGTNQEPLPLLCTRKYMHTARAMASPTPWVLMLTISSDRE